MKKKDIQLKKLKSFYKMFVLSLVVVVLVIGGVVGRNEPQCPFGGCSRTTDYSAPYRVEGDSAFRGGTPTTPTTPTPTPDPLKIPVNPMKGVNDEEGDMEYYDFEKKEIVNMVTSEEQIPLTTDYMSQATNLKETWKEIPDNLRVEFLKQHPDRVKDLSAEDLTYSTGLRNLIRDPSNPKVWKSIVDNGEAVGVLREMNYKINPASNLEGWEWAKEGSQHTLQHSTGPKIPMDSTGGHEILFNKGETTITNTGTGSVLKYSGNLKWEPMTTPQNIPNPFQAQPPGGQGEGGVGGDYLEKIWPKIQSILSLIDKNGKAGESGNGQGSVYGNHNSGINMGLSDGKSMSFEDEDQNTGIMQNDQDEEATANFDKEGDDIKAKNAIITTIDDGAIIYTQQETDILLAGTPNNDPNTPVSTETSELPFQITGTSTTPTSKISEIASTAITTPLIKIIPKSITGQAILSEEQTPEQINLGQYIKLINHDIDMSGKDITVDVLKSFSKTEAGGQNLRVYSGNIQIRFENQKILYPRLIYNAPYGISEISNKLDRANKFKLQHYTAQKSQLTDHKQITSVTDLTAKHPTKDLLISKIRKSMWKTKK